MTTRKNSADESRLREMIRDEIRLALRDEITALMPSIQEDIKDAVSKSIHDELSKLKQRMLQQENEIHALKRLVVQSEERRLKEQRKSLISNIVMKGVAEESEESHDMTKRTTQRLLQSVLADVEVIKVERIGPNINRQPRMIKVELKTSDMRNKILRTAKNHRESELKGIFIDADRTYLDRKEGNRLRHRMKELRTQHP